jgi:hypothetical protein
MNRINFIVDVFPDAELTMTIGNDAVFSIVISELNDFKKIDLKKMHQANLHSHQQFNFSICIDCSSEKINLEFVNNMHQCKDDLSQLFFHPRFERLNNNPVIFVMPDHRNARVDDEISVLINSFAKEQGYDGAKRISLTENKNENELPVNRLFNYNQQMIFKQWYYHALTSEYAISDYLGICNHSMDSFSTIAQLKSSIEEEVHLQLPQLYMLAKAYSSSRSKVSFLEDKLKLTQEDLENQKAYLDILKSQDEALKINEFYHHEYEILPLWYKKIGHIIKVLMGKRTFRSLYNNNIKKYKE